MYAFEIPGIRFSMPAGGAVARHRFVSVADNKAIAATGSNEVIGVSMNEVTAAELALNDRIVEIADGIVIVEASEDIPSGYPVASVADGKAKATVEHPCGIALTSASAAGELITVKLY